MGIEVTNAEKNRIENTINDIVKEFSSVAIISV
jgi:hypothetical protein